MCVKARVFGLVFLATSILSSFGAGPPGAPDPNAFQHWQNTLQSQPAISAVTHGQGKWVGVGAGLHYSTNGVDWTQTGFGGEHYWNVIYAEGVFVAVGQAYWCIAASTNGSDWRGLFGGGDRLLPFYGVAYGNGIFVAGGDLTPSFVVGTNPPTWWLPNHGWSAATQRFNCHGLFFGDGKFVATGVGATAVSTNGYDWIVTEHPSVAHMLLWDGVWHNGRYIVVGGGGSVLVSEDATNWTLRPTPTTKELRGVAAHNNQYVTVGENVMLISTNGLDWIEIPSIATNGYFTDVTVADNKFSAAYWLANDGPSAVRQSDPLNCLAPQFLKQPAGTEVRIGLATTLTGAADGTSTLTYQWQKNGVDIPGATASELSFASLKRTDDARYRVIARNGLGEATSAEAVLTVGLPANVLASPVSQSVVAGGSVTFSVAVEGTLPITNKWRKPGPTFVTQILNQATAFLHVDNVQAANAGIYGASLENKYGITASRAATLTVLTDADGDGLPDDWETQHGVTDPAEDSDGDGLTNLQEYQAGTDPRDAQSYLKVERIEVTPGAPAVVLRFLARSNHTYTIESREQLASAAWLRAFDVVASPADRVVAVTNAFQGDQSYFRLRTPRAE